MSKKEKRSFYPQGGPGKLPQPPECKLESEEQLSDKDNFMQSLFRKGLITEDQLES